MNETLLLLMAAVVIIGQVFLIFGLITQNRNFIIAGATPGVVATILGLGTLFMHPTIEASIKLTVWGALVLSAMVAMRLSDENPFFKMPNWQAGLMCLGLLTISLILAHRILYPITGVRLLDSAACKSYSPRAFSAAKQEPFDPSKLRAARQESFKEIRDRQSSLSPIPCKKGLLGIR